MKTFPLLPITPAQQATLQEAAEIMGQASAALSEAAGHSIALGLSITRTQDEPEGTTEFIVSSYPDVLAVSPTLGGALATVSTIAAA